MNLLLSSLVVFALTLLITKSKIFAGKREFVESRYETTKDIKPPSWLHRWWHALWTCPMCSGFWFAIPVCFFVPYSGLIVDVLAVFGINWLLHCIESSAFFIGQLAENLDELAAGDMYKKTMRILDEKERELRDQRRRT